MKTKIMFVPNNLISYFINTLTILIKIDKSCYYLIFFAILSVNSFSQIKVYQGKKSSNVTDKFTLDYKDSTYIYNENLNEGCLRYAYLSNGKFKVNQDTLTLISKMPKNESLSGYIHNLTTDEIKKNKFSYIYPVNDIVEQGYIKIYFDNLAEPKLYKTYTFENDKLIPIKIKSYVTLKRDSIIKTEKNTIRLFNYLIIEKPKNNKLIINSITDCNTSDSYFFDLNEIQYNCFHFYTRVYSNYYDFTGLKFIISNDSLIRYSKNENRYKFGKISNVYNKKN
jgi:hypothetical protein